MERARDAGVYTGHSRTHRNLRQQAEDLGKLKPDKNLSRERGGRQDVPAFDT